MNPSTTISFEDLGAALRLVLSQAEAELGPVFDLQADYYWTIDGRAAYLRQPPREGHIGVGMLSDDVESVSELLARPTEEGVFVWHDLEHLCGVLARIAAMTAPPAETRPARS